ncbi:hypothetical protein OEZ86_007986 [Tetradesmus obliquus]|nr:hypothetical protein OEZ86_007986 [Tetradesmus obliquus]
MGSTVLQRKGAYRAGDGALAAAPAAVRTLVTRLPEWLAQQEQQRYVRGGGTAEFIAGSMTVAESRNIVQEHR